MRFPRASGVLLHPTSLPGPMPASGKICHSFWPPATSQSTKW